MKTHHSVMTITHQKLTNLVTFRAISIITVGQTYLEMCPPAAQRKKAKRAYKYVFINRFNSKDRLCIFHTSYTIVDLSMSPANFL